MDTTRTEIVTIPSLEAEIADLKDKNRSLCDVIAETNINELSAHIERLKAFISGFG